jgi:hypothetical protein
MVSGYIDPYGGMNGTIAGIAAKLGVAHLLTIGGGESVQSNTRFDASSARAEELAAKLKGLGDKTDERLQPATGQLSASPSFRVQK